MLLKHGESQRCAAPEVTEARLRPHLDRVGVTRCADVTGLDRCGIPVIVAVRPSGLVFQVGLGKGGTVQDATMSALMEAAEVWHFENAADRARRTSLSHLEGAVMPSALTGYIEGYFNPRFVLPWLPADELISGRSVWVPASAACLADRMLHELSTNGLASGNHPIEATLHALYELLERDAMAGVIRDGRLDRTSCRNVDLATVDNGATKALLDLLAAAEVNVVLVHVKSRVPVHTFWCILLDGTAFATTSTVNSGWGSHRSAAVAASRAITEAAQSRLSFIYAGREDFAYKRPYHGGFDAERVRRTWLEWPADAAWSDFRDQTSPDLMVDYSWLISELRAAGVDPIYRVDLTDERIGIPVVKVITPTLACNLKLV